MRNPPSDIANLMKTILGTDVKIKATQDSFLKESKKLFCKFIKHFDQFDNKADKVLKDHGLDIDPFLEDLYMALDYLILFTFDDTVAEIVQHYMYGRDDEGSVKYQFEGKELIINTPEKLFDFLVALGEKAAAKDDLD
jgi:hypothetical protein